MKFLHYCLLLSLVASPILAMEPVDQADSPALIQAETGVMDLPKEPLWLDVEYKRFTNQQTKEFYYYPSYEVFQLLVRHKKLSLFTPMQPFSTLGEFLQNEIGSANNDNALNFFKLFITDNGIALKDWACVAYNLSRTIQDLGDLLDDDDGYTCWAQLTRMFNIKEKTIELFKLLMTHVPLSKLSESDRQGIERLYLDLRMTYPSQFN